jgi:hypothetical protein
MTKEIKLTVLEYLKYERDERIPELIETYDGDEEYVIDEIYGPLETILAGKTDEDLVKMIDEVMDDELYPKYFNDWVEWNDDEDDLDTLHCDLVWEIITEGIRNIK